METINDRLCSYCTALIRCTVLLQQDSMLASHHPTTKSLFSSASAGCPLCTTICSSFYEFLDQEKSVPCHPERHTHKARLRYKLGRVDEIGPSGKFIYQFYCQTSEHADDTNHGHIGNLAVKPIAGEII